VNLIAPVKRDQQGKGLLKDGIPQSEYKGILEEVLKPGNYRVHPACTSLKLSRQ